MTAFRNDPRRDGPCRGWRVAAAAALLAGMAGPAAAQTAIPAAAGYPDGALRQAVGQLVVLDQAFRLCIPELVPTYEATLAAERTGGLLTIEPYGSQFTALAADQQALAGGIQCKQMDLAASLLVQSPDHLMSFVFRNAGCVMTALRRLPRRETLDDETRRQVIAIGEGCASLSAQQAMTDARYRPPAAGPSPHDPTVAAPAPAIPASKTELPGHDVPAPAASVMPSNPAPPARRWLEMPTMTDILPVPDGQPRSVPPRPIAPPPPGPPSTRPPPTRPPSTRPPSTRPPAVRPPAVQPVVVQPAVVQPAAADPVRPQFPPPATEAASAIRDLPAPVPAATQPRPDPAQAARPAYRQAPARDPFSRDRGVGIPIPRTCQFC